MKRFFFFCACSLLCARENPFLPSVKINEPSAVIDESEFNKIAFSFPKDARKLARLHLEYLAVDGSVKSYSIAINQPIDWHKVYMLLSEDELLKRSNQAPTTNQESISSSQDFIPPPPEEMPPLKATPAQPASTQATHSILNAQASTSAPSIQDDLPSKKDSVQIHEQAGVENIKLHNDLAFEISKEVVLIYTKARLLRQFSLNKPNRIVLDFAANGIKKAHTFPLIDSSFSALSVGIHRGFFRVVLHTDSKYDYDISYSDQGCKVILK